MCVCSDLQSRRSEKANADVRIPCGTQALQEVIPNLDIDKPLRIKDLYEVLQPRHGSISTHVCLAFPAIAALADGFESYAMIDASGGFTRTQVDMGIPRMQQAGVVPVGYSNVAVEILADNAAPEADAVYAALGMPFGSLVFGLRQYYSHA